MPKKDVTLAPTSPPAMPMSSPTAPLTPLPSPRTTAQTAYDRPQLVPQSRLAPNNTRTWDSFVGTGTYPNDPPECWPELPPDPFLLRL